MPKIEQEISTAAKRTFNRLKKEYGEDFVVENLLNEYKEFETAAAEKEILERELESLKKTSPKEAPMTTPSNSTPDIMAILNNTIEVYARENDRLLKIVNFSEYDGKINSLKAKIEEQSIALSGLNNSLKNEKKKSVDLEYEKSKLEETVEELTTALESEKTEVSNLVTKTVNLETEKAQRDTTITSYASELEKYKAMVEELKSQITLPHEPEVESPTYS